MARESFHNWAAHDDKYAPSYKRLTKPSLTACDEAIAGMQTLTPHAFNSWWATKHMHYWKIPGRQQRLLVELLFHWSSRVAAGKIPLNDS